MQVVMSCKSDFHMLIGTSKTNMVTEAVQIMVLEEPKSGTKRVVSQAKIPLMFNRNAYRSPSTKNMLARAPEK